MIKTAVIYILTLGLSALISLTGCGQDKILSGTEQAAVLAFSEAATDNLFAGLTGNDDAAFSRDFDSDMQAAYPASNFAAWKQDLDNTLGTYLSRQLDEVTQSDEFYVVVYQAKFEREEPVSVGLAFHAVPPHAISHMWFDSDELHR